MHCKRWECKDCRQIFTRNEKLIRPLKEERCTGGKTKIICSGGKFKHILNSCEKASYGRDTRTKCVDMVEKAWCEGLGF